MAQDSKASRVLIIDDDSNARLALSRHLVHAGYEVREAPDGALGLRLALEDRPDLVILDIMMPGIDGLAVCRELRANPRTHEIPILLLTGLSDRETRSEGIAAGADDFVSKPVFGAELLARVRNLLKIRFLTTQLHAVQGSVADFLSSDGDAPRSERVLWVGGASEAETLGHAAGERFQVMACRSEEALQTAIGFDPDSIVLTADSGTDSALELVRGLRSHESLSAVPLLLVSEPLDSRTRLEVYESGVDECLAQPFQLEELIARVQAHARRRNERRGLEDQLRSAAQRAILDGLTNAHNRAFFDHYLHYQCEHATRHKKSFSIILLDLDHFKDLNDSFGHLLGDQVLRRVVELIRARTRSSDVLCRYGGEEFVVLLPDTAKGEAMLVAERIRAALASDRNWERLPASVTASFGVATFGEDAADSGALVHAADLALYRAKQGGRNRIAQLGSPPPQSPPTNVEPIFRHRRGGA